LKIGILGGTFDPVHRAHTSIARLALETLGLDRVLFMVAKNPPHKVRARLSSGWHRYAMVALATAEEPRMLASAWELNRQGPSYTVDTLEHFTSHCPENDYCFIAGSDSLKELHLWKDYGKLLSKHCFFFVERAGVEADLETLGIAPPLRGKIRVVCEEEKQSVQPGSSFLIRSYPPPFSSSRIRESFRSGLAPDPDSLWPSVLSYIQKYRLYE
jgi:nicotinate-nucleotide adenylyltransferase